MPTESSGNRITVSTVRTPAREDGLNECKTSIFVDPETRLPGAAQMQEIAATIAAFMNADGGTLWIGVADNGAPRGIESDLEILRNPNSRVVARGPRANDEGYVYHGTPDHYELKLRAIVRAYLDTFAGDYIQAVKIATLADRTICKVEIKKVPDDLIVYTYVKRSGVATYSEEIFVRRGNGKERLTGFDRDNFVRERLRRHLLSEWESVTAGNGSAERKLDAMMAALKEFRDTHVITGPGVVVTGAQPLDEEHLKPMGKPKGVVFDGAHLCDVKNWKEVFRAIYCKLDEISSASFDSLPNDEPKWFKRAKRCTGCYQEKFGTANDVRAVELSTKAYLWNENYFLRKLMSACGVDASRFMVRA